jgi:hypothetical protein
MNRAWVFARVVLGVPIATEQLKPRHDDRVDVVSSRSDLSVPSSVISAFLGL